MTCTPNPFGFCVIGGGLEMPQSRLFITQTTDNKVPYHLSKVKTFWLKLILIMGLPNFFDISPCQAIKQNSFRTKIGLSLTLNSGFSSRSKDASSLQMHSYW
jgi:hypothetical protein